MQTYTGFTLEERDGIYIYRVYDITRDAVDVWYEIDKAQSVAAAVSPGYVLRLWYLEKMIFPTPYFTSKSRQAILETPENLYEATALVIVNPLGFQTMRLFLNRNTPDRHKTMFRIFQDEASALAWLHERRGIISKFK